MLRFDGQDIATDRLGFFWFVERAIEFRLRDGLGDPGRRNSLNFIFHGSFPPRPDFHGSVNFANQSPIFPVWQPPNCQIGSQLRLDPTRASKATTLGRALHDSRLPLRVLLIVLKTLSVSQANEFR